MVVSDSDIRQANSGSIDRRRFVKNLGRRLKVAVAFLRSEWIRTQTLVICNGYDGRAYRFKNAVVVAMTNSMSEALRTNR